MQMSSDRSNQVLKSRITFDILSKIWSHNQLDAKSLPISVPDFLQLATKHSEFYVDKTSFIKNILEFANVGMKMIVITRPPGWGKSVNISMLKYFFSRYLDINGDPITPSPYKNVFFGGGFTIREGRNFKQIELSALKISGLKNFSNFALSRSVFGSASIIFMELGKVQGNNYAQIKRSILKEIKNAYEVHQYIKYTDKSCLYWPLYKQIERALNLPNQILMDEPIDLFLKGLVSILDSLKKFGENKCYIFIDDFDQPVNKLINKGMNAAKEVANLIYGILYPVFAISKNLRIVAVGKINIFENLLSEYQQFLIFQDQFYEDFGFEQIEIKKNILDNYFNKIQGKTQALTNFFLKKIVQQFGGYLCSKYSPLKIHPEFVFRFLQQAIERYDIAPALIPSVVSHWFFEKFITLNGLPNILEYHHINGKEQKSLALQFLISTNNKDISGPQINNLAYSYGLVTGNLETVGKWKIRNPRFPNASVVRAIQNQVINRFRVEFDFAEFSQIDLQSADCLCEKFQSMLKCFYKAGLQVNKQCIETAFYYRYKYSSNPKWLLISDLIEKLNGVALNVFGPKNQENQVYLISFCYFPSQELRKQLLSQIIFKELQGNTLETVIEFGSLFGGLIQQYVIRFISVIPDKQLQLFLVTPLCPDIVLSCIQAQNIASNMKRKKVKYQCDKIRRSQKMKRFECISELLNLLGARRLSQNQSLQELIQLHLFKKKRSVNLHEVKITQAKKFKRKTIEM